MPNHLSPVPIYVMMIVFAVASFFMFLAMPAAVGNDIMDGFVFAATMIGAYRFGPLGAESIFKRHPNGPNFLVASAFILCVSICIIRAMRILGLELGWIGTDAMNYAFGAVTALMAFGIILLVTSPELHVGKLMLDRAFALAVFVLLSGVMSVIVYMVRTA